MPRRRKRWVNLIVDNDNLLVEPSDCKDDSSDVSCSPATLRQEVELLFGRKCPSEASSTPPSSPFGFSIGASPVSTASVGGFVKKLELAHHVAERFASVSDVSLVGGGYDMMRMYGSDSSSQYMSTSTDTDLESSKRPRSPLVVP